MRRLATNRASSALLALLLGASVPSFLAPGCRIKPADEASCERGELRACMTACDRGVHGTTGCARLVEPYASGKQGLPRDAVAASALASMACAGGVTSACRADAWPLDEPLEPASRAERGDPAWLEACGALTVPGNPSLRLSAGTGAKLVRSRFRCDRGEDSGCRELAELSMRGRELPRDPRRAVGLLEKPCARGDLASCVSLGEVLSDGKGADRRAAAGYFERGCAGGFLTGCARLALVGLGTDKSLVEKKVRLDAAKKACEGEVWAGCFALAALYRTGLGGKVDVGAADRASAKYLQLADGACTGGDGSACMDIAGSRVSSRMWIGEDVPVDVLPGQESFWLKSIPSLASRPGGLSYADAIVHFGKVACEREVAAGCTALGELLGGKGHRAEAAPLLEKACALGDLPGCDALAAFFGEGNPRELAFAEQACAGGHGGACRRAGAILAHDKKALAALRFERGCVLGDSASCDERLHLIPSTARPGPDWRAALALSCVGQGRNCYYLARDMQLSDGEPPDTACAVAMFTFQCKRHASFDDWRSCGRLAEMVWTGKGGAEGRAKATALSRAACFAPRRGTFGTHRLDCDACARLVSSREGGEDDGDLAELRALLCNAGDASSCKSLAVQLRSGRGVKRDRKLAAVVDERATSVLLRTGCVGGASKGTDPTVGTSYSTSGLLGACELLPEGASCHVGRGTGACERVEGSGVWNPTTSTCKLAEGEPAGFVGLIPQGL